MVNVKIYKIIINAFVNTDILELIVKLKLIHAIQIHVYLEIVKEKDKILFVSVIQV